MDAAEVVIGMIDGYRVTVVLEFLRERTVRRVKRVTPILKLRFCRSTKLVEMCFGSGLPLNVAVRVPMHSEGLYRVSIYPKVRRRALSASHSPLPSRTLPRRPQHRLYGHQS